MIRTKTKIYAETNDPDTVLAGLTPANNKWITGAGNKLISSYDPGPNRILITDGAGGITALNFNGQSNKLIATDASGNIVLIDRGVL